MERGLAQWWRIGSACDWKKLGKRKKIGLREKIEEEEEGIFVGIVREERKFRGDKRGKRFV